MPKLIISLRKINTQEREVIKESLTDISDKICDFIANKKYKIYLSTINKTLFLVPEELTVDLQNFSKDFKIVQSGIPLGFIRNKRFYLSLEAAELFFRSNLIDHRKFLVLNDKGEKSVLYGNPIKKEMVLNFSPEIQNNKLIFFLNNNKELLGIGLSEINLEIFKNLNFKDEVAMNLIDKGSYLRKKQ